MGKAVWHAESSAKKFGGKAEDYLDIHTLIDSSRNAFPDLRHRALTHTSWFIGTILPQIFGEKRKNSAGDVYAVRDIGEQHVLEDFDDLFIPSVQDFLGEMELQKWMDNARDGAVPPSRKKMAGEKKVPPARQGNRKRKAYVKDMKKILDDIREERELVPRGCGSAGRGVID